MVSVQRQDFCTKIQCVMAEHTQLILSLTTPYAMRRESGWATLPGIHYGAVDNVQKLMQISNEIK